MATQAPSPLVSRGQRSVADWSDAADWSAEDPSDAYDDDRALYDGLDYEDSVEGVLYDSVADDDDEPDHDGLDERAAPQTTTTKQRLRRKVLSRDELYLNDAAGGNGQSAERMPILVCPQISAANCEPEDRFRLTNDCCTYCFGHDFCQSPYTSAATKGRCHPNANCFNRPFDRALLNRTYKQAHDEERAARSISGDDNDLHQAVVVTLTNGLESMYECKCREGFVGDGKRQCKDFNECADERHNVCDSDTMRCANTIGSYECRCKKGFRPSSYDSDRAINDLQQQQHIDTGEAGVAGASNGQPQRQRQRQKCVDVNECADGKLNRCHSHAKCINTIGSYKCQCKRGYLGNGFECHKWFSSEPNVAAYLHRHRGAVSAAAAASNRTSQDSRLYQDGGTADKSGADRTRPEEATLPLSSVLDDENDADDDAFAPEQDAEASSYNSLGRPETPRKHDDSPSDHYDDDGDDDDYGDDDDNLGEIKLASGSREKQQPPFRRQQASIGSAQYIERLIWRLFVSTLHRAICAPLAPDAER